MKCRLCTLFFLSTFIQGISASGLCDYFENTSQNVSAACRKQMKIVCNNTALAWKLFDASSKFFNPGMSYSNVVDIGNFPECPSIDYEDENGRIFGKFCGLSHVVVDFFLTPQTEQILTKFGINTNATSKPQKISSETISKVNREMKDILFPEIPVVLSKLSSCVPDACTPREVGNFYWYVPILNGILDEIAHIPLIVYTDLSPCETVNSNTNYEAHDIAVITFFVLVAALMFASTIYDAICQNFKKAPYHPLLIAFSVLYNGKKLLEISNNTTEQIQCFHGMRFISMLWVMTFHSVAGYQTGAIGIGIENYSEVKTWVGSIWNRYILSGELSVDTFFFMTGFLLVFTYLKRATEETAYQQITKIPKMYLHRYLRLTPSVGAMYLVVITIYRFLGRGPNFSLVASFLKKGCQEKWWKFFLYIQNYTDPDDMCVMPTWYLSADMQMFILAPLVIIPVALYVKKKFKLVIGCLIGLTILTIIIPMIIRFAENDIGNTYATHERFNNFLIGIIFGIIMRFYKQKPFIFSPIVNVAAWMIIIVVSLFFNLYWFDVLNNEDLTKYTLFMAFYRPVWCISLAYMVYACYHNQGGIAQWILTRPTFQILGRLSYSMYVLHYLVEVFAFGTLKSNTYFSNYFMFYMNCGHFIVTLILSVLWVLAFEYPMFTIDKYLLGDDKGKSWNMNYFKSLGNLFKKN